ncbi:hypothetical protein ACLBOM_31270 [Escherichia coli]
MKCHEFDQKKDMASFCGQGLAAWRYTKPVLVAEIDSLANQLQIPIPGLPGMSDRVIEYALQSGARLLRVHERREGHDGSIAWWNSLASSCASTAVSIITLLAT